MKKLFSVFCIFAFVSNAYSVETNELTTMRTWSIKGFANTVEELIGHTGFSDSGLLNMVNFANKKNYNFSIIELSDACNAVMNKENCEELIDKAITNHNRVVAEVDATAGGYWGCSNNNPNISIIRDVVVCKNLQSDERIRCEKCTNNGGSFERLKGADKVWGKGRCYVEVNGWTCLGKGWTGKGRTCDENAKYNQCRLMRKYVDAEKKFKCDAKEVIENKLKAEGKEDKHVVYSGCAQHGIPRQSSTKHPPFNATTTFFPINCELPLANNNEWRIHLNENGEKTDVHAGPDKNEWCMPNPDSKPWDKPNLGSNDVWHLIFAVPQGTETIFWNQYK